MEELSKYINRRLKRAEDTCQRVMADHGDKPNETHTYFGGQSLGYWQGICAAYDNVLAWIERTKEENCIKKGN